MALDGLVIRAVVHELQTCVGGRINKIHQPNEHDIVLQIRANGVNTRLLLSANPTYPRIHPTNSTFTNPMEAPMFCMLLRKYCESGIIESVRQVAMERIVQIDIRQRDELGDVNVKRIVMEVMGRHSNIILLDPQTGVIADGIHHVTPAISSYRIVLPGSVYTPPPEQKKADPLTLSAEQIEALLLNELQEGEEASEEAVRKAVVTRLSGVSPIMAKEIVYLAGLTQNGAEAKAESVSKAAFTVFQKAAGYQFQPNIVETADGKMAFSCMPLTHLQGETTYFETIGNCLEAYYGDKAERDTVRQRAFDLLRLVQNEKNKNIKKLDKLKNTLEEAKDADKLRIMGELLTASLHAAQKGETQVVVVDYYDENQRTVTISLDPLLTPSENAQRYFKKYTKSKNSLLIVQEQLSQTYDEIRYLEGIQQQLEVASYTDIEEIREELIDQGYVRKRQKKTSKKKKPDKPILSRFISSEGIDMYVGKNNTQNEYLTNRLAHSSDTWLHTKDIPGSHVVIRSHDYNDETLQEAAQLAAYFSQARESSQVPVDYTLVKHVRKPNGAKPGFVIYDRQKTMFVTPDSALVKKLQSNS